MTRLFRAGLLCFLAGIILFSGQAPAQDLDDFLDQVDRGSSTVIEPGVASLPFKFRWDDLWKALTPKEKDLIKQGILPKNYPILKEIMARGGAEGKELAKQTARKGKPGSPSFSDSYGDPAGMLSWAENNGGNTKLTDFIKQIRKGDIILAGPGKEERRDKDAICFLTRGPFHHSLICVSEGPPPEFIDATGKGVTRTQWTYFWGGGNYRIVRPTEGLPADQAKKAVDAAVSYATNQLGKPYDCGFTDSDGDRAFYCSELAYKAYRDGAGMKDLLPAKSPERDSLVVSLWAVIDGLGPQNKHEMMDGLLHAVKKVMESKPQNWDILDQYVIDEVLPKCSATAGLLDTPEDRKAAKEIVKEIREGRAFPNFQAAQKNYQDAQARGEFTDHWYTFGAGKAKQAVSLGKKAWALGKDLASLKSRSGLSVTATVGLLGKVFMPLYRNLGTFSEYLQTAGSKGMISIPAGVKTLLSATEFLSDIREKTQDIPILGSLAQILPGKARQIIQSDFTSPTDLSQLSSWHYDYFPS